MELTKICDKYFHCSNLYDLFGIDKNADRRSLKKAYFKRSLRYYPGLLIVSERSQTDHEASEKFKTLFKIYSILSDNERKWVYDKTGCVWLDEELLGHDFDWVGHWRLTFKKANYEAIVSFLNKYRGSQEETADIKQLFRLYKGNIQKIMNLVLCSTREDEKRIQDIVQFIVSAHNPYPVNHTPSCILKNTAKEKKSVKRNAVSEENPQKKRHREL
ncbi:dnaJ homolog subfamily C member 9-like [Daphnia carinata]|uniref:dnaJ homolog subfamily C member 9-like n=1 Tax=Daphnia carinata TaxID=120202 RepID=UPI00257FE955|nr:dnaJ homolog subfamily C member 9-like [Daphnia carinata]